MIDRYKNAGITGVFSEWAKYQRWSLIEAIVYLHAEGGNNIHKRDVIRDFNPTPERIAEVEQTTRHDVQAYLVCLEEHLKCSELDMSGVHTRLTSSDLVDTGMALAVKDAMTILTDRVAQLLQQYQLMAQAQAETILDGRTHGRVALPITGEERWKRMLVDIQRWERDLKPLKGKLGGPVGSSFNLVEVEACAMMLRTELETGLARQCLSRHAVHRLSQHLAYLAGVLENHATNLRLWMIEGVEEYRINRSPGYVGSSSMPFKNNPTDLERVCGLARLVRGYNLAISESCSLWHERDISHSCVERVAIEDMFHCLMQMVKDLFGVMASLEPVEYQPRSLANVQKVEEANRQAASGSRAEAWESAEI